MTDLALPATPRSLLTADARTIARNRAESRFKSYGLAAVLTALLSLALLLFSIFGNGISAFQQTKILIPVELTAAKLDKSGTRDLEVMKKVTTIGYGNLLDAALNPVAKGCIGELYVGRAGLARGYLKRSDLSATRFVPDPFGAPGGRLYRTGDLARYHADGVIEYAGRIDHQVKIRGFRIELGEIESRLQAHDDVDEAVVQALARLKAGRGG